MLIGMAVARHNGQYSAECEYERDADHNRLTHAHVHGPIHTIMLVFVNRCALFVQNVPSFRDTFIS